MKPSDLHESWLTKGKEKARTYAYYSVKDRYRKQVRASLMTGFINSGQTIGKAEQMALCHEDYIAACRECEAAEMESGYAAVEYDAAKAWFEAWRTMESTKRAEMTLK